MLSVAYAECQLCRVSVMLSVSYAERLLCRVSVMLTVIYVDCHIQPFMLSIIMLNVFML